MPVDFESIQGGTVAAFLAGDGTAPAAPAPATDPLAVQAPADGAVSHQDQTSAPAALDVATGIEAKPEGAVEGQQGAELGSDKSATPDAKPEGQEFKLPKELRDAYDTLNAKVKPYEEFLNSVSERELSPVMLNEGLNLLDSFISLEGAEADGAKFLSSLYQLSPQAFQNAMLTLVDDNKEFIASRVLGMQATPEQIDSFKQFMASGQAAKVTNDDITVPEFDLETGEPLSEQMQAYIRNNIEKAKAAEARDTARSFEQQAREAAAEENSRAEAARVEEARVDTAITNYREARLGVVDRTIASLGLQALPTDKEEVKSEKEFLASIIKGATVFSFGSDTKAKSLYQNAVDNIADGKTRLAEGLAFNIEKAMGVHAQKVASFLLNLYQKANAQQTTQVQKAATGARPEISDTGAATPIGVSTGSYAPFSAASIDARLAELEASGRLPRR